MRLKLPVKPHSQPCVSGAVFLFVSLASMAVITMIASISGDDGGETAVRGVAWAVPLPRLDRKKPKRRIERVASKRPSLLRIIWPKRDSTSEREGLETPEMTFPQAVSSFVFGDKNPNGHFERAQWAAAAHRIQELEGVVAAEEMRPFLDPSTISASSEDSTSEARPLLCTWLKVWPPKRKSELLQMIFIAKLNLT
jgi:hypothetical protein